MELKDLSNFANSRFSDTFDYEPFNPLNPDEKMGFTVTIKSAKQDECKRFIEENARKAAIERFNAQKAGRLYIPNLKDEHKKDIDFCVLATERFNNLTKDGKPYGETKEEITDIYKGFEWLVVQVIQAAADDANFLQA